MSDLRSAALRIAATLPPGDPTRRELLQALSPKTAAFPREGTARIANLNDRGFTLYYSFTRNPLGLAAEHMAGLGVKARESMAKFVTRLGEGIGVPLVLTDKSAYVLLDIDQGSIVFKVEGAVKNGSRMKLTEEMILGAEGTVFDRYGYNVSFI